MIKEIKNREKFEWVRMWWENAGDETKPRILLIGDSITAGYRPMVNEALKEMLLVDQLATSRAIDDPAILKEINYMLGEYNYIGIHLNNGLHGWHVGKAEYTEGLKKIINTIRTHQKECRIILSTTTPRTVKGNTGEIDLEKDRIIRERNEAVRKTAVDTDLPVNDLYEIVYGKPWVRDTDGSHYNSDGLRLLSEQVVKAIIKHIGETDAL